MLNYNQRLFRYGRVHLAKEHRKVIGARLRRLMPGQFAAERSQAKTIGVSANITAKLRRGSLEFIDPLHLSMVMEYASLTPKMFGYFAKNRRVRVVANIERFAA